MIYVYIYIWHCPINCLFDLAERKRPPRTKKYPVPNPSCPGQPKEPARQPFNQPVSHAASGFGQPAGQPTSQPARARSSQAQVLGPKVDPKCVQCGGCPRLRNEQDWKKTKWVPKHSCPRQSKEPASQSAVQPASRPPGQHFRPPGRPAGQPASQDPEQPGLNLGPNVAPFFFPVRSPRAEAPDTSWSETTAKMKPKRAYPGQKK